MSYIKGRSYEHYIEKILKKKGFTVVIRSAGSKGPVDLIALHSTKKEIWFIQVKGGKRQPSLSKLRLDHLSEYKDTGLTSFLFDADYHCKMGFFVKRGKHWETDLELRCG